MSQVFLYSIWSIICSVFVQYLFSILVICFRWFLCILQKERLKEKYFGQTDTKPPRDWNAQEKVGQKANINLSINEINAFLIFYNLRSRCTIGPDVEGHHVVVAILFLGMRVLIWSSRTLVFLLRSFLYLEYLHRV